MKDGNFQARGHLRTYKSFGEKGFVISKPSYSSERIFYANRGPQEVSVDRKSGVSSVDQLKLSVFFFLSKCMQLKAVENFFEILDQSF